MTETTVIPALASGYCEGIVSLLVAAGKQAEKAQAEEATSTGGGDRPEDHRPVGIREMES